MMGLSIRLWVDREIRVRLIAVGELRRRFVEIEDDVDGSGTTTTHSKWVLQV